MAAKRKKRKFTAKQLAAQRLFAKRAKAGTLRKNKRKTKRNPLKRKTVKRSYSGKYPTKINTVSSIKKGVVSVTLNNGERYNVAAKETGGIMPQPGKYLSSYLKKKPVRKSAKPQTKKRNPSTKYAIRASKPVKTGYRYYYLRGREFVKDMQHGDTFGKAAAEKRMREILPQLPRAIASITLVKV